MFTYSDTHLKTIAAMIMSLILTSVISTVNVVNEANVIYTP